MNYSLKRQTPSRIITSLQVYSHLAPRQEKVIQTGKVLKTRRWQIQLICLKLRTGISKHDSQCTTLVTI